MNVNDLKSLFSLQCNLILDDAGYIVRFGSRCIEVLIALKKILQTNFNFSGFDSMERTIQEIFDDFERISLAVEDAKNAVDAAVLTDLSDKDFISAEQADEHLIACLEREHREAELENLSAEWTVLQDILVEKLCRINTKVLVKDKRDDSAVLIHCEGGTIIIEEKAE
ncbi:hypothetical protein [Pedobacter aquatilis]|uniref:hypothetical protein n=1 Tax=Pedobacter aquatilis TaxID=351343 RepID=UPI0029307453|nr:hypothetical protein [Pedobacter aquatilis]